MSGTVYRSVRRRESRRVRRRPPARSIATSASSTAAQTGPDVGLGKVLKAVGAIAGSTTIATALLFYFGWSRAYYFYNYFGVDVSMLNLTTRDYIQLSVDGLFVPILAVASLGFVLLIGFRFAQLVAPSLLDRHRIAPALQIFGAVLVVTGLSRVIVDLPLNRGLLVAPTCLLVGSCLLFVGMRRSRTSQEPGRSASGWQSVVEWAAVLTLVSASLFWAANDYSADVGQGRAQQLAAELPTMPGTRIYAVEDLHLDAPGVTETTCPDDAAAYHFRYDGLRLILRSGDAFLLMPSHWSPHDGVAFVISQSDKIRFEFTPSGAPERGTASCG